MAVIAKKESSVFCEHRDLAVRNVQNTALGVKDTDMLYMSVAFNNLIELLRITDIDDANKIPLLAKHNEELTGDVTTLLPIDRTTFDRLYVNHRCWCFHLSISGKEITSSITRH